MTQTKSTVQMTSHTEDYDAHLRQVIDTYTDALETCGAKALLLHAGGIKTAFLDDRTYPFIVNPHFNYWAPLHQNNDCLIFFRPGEKPTLFYLQPEDYWHQPPRDLQEAWCHHWQIQSIGHIREAHNQIGDPSGICYIGEDTGLANAWRIGHINPKAVLDQVHFARATKTDYELACMQEANRIAARGHKAAAKAFYDGLSEFEINTQYLATIAHRETETPYSSIIAVNAHAAVLHYQHYDTFRLSDEERHSFLIDAGACYKGYASDITRTYSARGGIFAELIDEMEKHQLSLISKIKTGILYEELNRAMHEQLAEILRAFDLIRLAPEVMMENNLTFYFCPHGLGHLLGLQTHDIGGYQQNPGGDTKGPPDKYPALRLTRGITERQVFTMEPGLYFIEPLLKQLSASAFGRQVNWQRLETLAPCGGIRIEDNVYIKDDDIVNMTRRAFKELDDND